MDFNEPDFNEPDFNETDSNKPDSNELVWRSPYMVVSTQLFPRPMCCRFNFLYMASNIIPGWHFRQVVRTRSSFKHFFFHTSIHEFYLNFYFLGYFIDNFKEQSHEVAGMQLQFTHVLRTFVKTSKRLKVYIILTKQY